MWAACCTALFGSLRAGECTTESASFDSARHLALDDVQVDRSTNPSVVYINIKVSKTELFRKGYLLRIGATHSHVCAVKALMNYLHLRGQTPEPLFTHENGLPLTRCFLTTWLRDAVVRLGIESNYSGRSLRIGAATTAAVVGIPDHLIKTLGRWLSDAYQTYIQTPSEVLDKVAARLVS